MLKAPIEQSLGAALEMTKDKTVAPGPARVSGEKEIRQDGSEGD
jgi:hypothetical protein